MSEEFTDFCPERGVPARSESFDSQQEDGERSVQSARCNNCNALLDNEKIYSVIRFSESSEGTISSIEALAFFCEKCGLRCQPEREEEWMSDLTQEEREVHQLGKAGKTQAEIGTALIPKRSQSQVSRIQKRIAKKQSTARLERIRRTGGA